jgi:hypothetical protein
MEGEQTAPNGCGPPQVNLQLERQRLEIVDDQLLPYRSFGPFAAASRNRHLQAILGFGSLRQRFSALEIGELTADADEGHEILSYLYNDPNTWDRPR